MVKHLLLCPRLLIYCALCSHALHVELVFQDTQIALSPRMHAILLTVRGDRSIQVRVREIRHYLSVICHEGGGSYIIHYCFLSELSKVYY